MSLQLINFVNESSIFNENLLVQKNYFFFSKYDFFIYLTDFLNNGFLEIAKDLNFSAPNVEIKINMEGCDSKIMSSVGEKSNEIYKNEKS